MKRLKKNKIFKKAFSSVLPLAFLFVTICSGNIAHADFEISVLNPNGSSTEKINLNDKKEFEGTTKDSSGSETSSKGTIEYTNDASGTPTLILKNMDLTVEGHPLIDLGSGADSSGQSVQIELVGNNKINLAGDANLVDAAEAGIFFIGDGTLDVTTEHSEILACTEGSINTASVTFSHNGTINFSSNSSEASPSRMMDSFPVFKIKSGKLNIDAKGKSVFLECNKFIISNGELRINQDIGANVIGTNNFEMTGGLISINSGNTDTDVDYYVGGSIEANDNFNMKNGSINITSNSESQSCLLLSPNPISLGSGSKDSKNFIISGGKIELKLINTSNTASPIYVGNGSSLILEDGFISAIGGSASAYGIGGNGGASININRSQIEASGSQGALQTELFTLSPDFTWTALVGDNSGSTTRINPKTASELDPYKYVKLSLASTLAPNTSVFDKNTAAKEHTEVTVKLNLNGNKLAGIFLGDTQLTSGKEFAENMVAGSSDLESVTFEVREFLDSLAVGTHTLTFAFDNGTSADFTLEVVDSAQSSDTTQKDEVPKTGDQSKISLM